jgi:hypothetical protein
MRLSVLALGMFTLAWTPPTFAAAPPPSESDLPRLFHPPRRPPLPTVTTTSWPRNPIDSFVLARLEARHLAPNRPADRLRLLRRVTFDLTGLPPTLQEQEDFLRDLRPGAYGRLVERLLASPHFGERWAQHWLDLVRYAESDGFKEDALRPDAHKYRDHVIRSFNANVPYDVFVRRQLAGDELEPDNPEALIATGFNRLWPDEYNAANLEQRRQEILDDTTDTTGLVFLGLTVGCARCHDHKYDPISQREYFRLQAFFASMQPRQLPAVDQSTLQEHQRKVAAWEAATASVRQEMDRLASARRAQARATALTKFRAEIQEAVKIPAGKRTPYQELIARMAEKQMDRAAHDALARLPAQTKKQYQALERKLAALGQAPAPLPLAMAVTDIGPVAPPTYRLSGGDWRKPAKEVQPAFPTALGHPAVDTHLPPGLTSTGRRSALARWLTRGDHPLTARVMVNRLWQHHFGQGIVATASDFGVQGTPPTHPELLDWLACELVDSGWDLKHMHRLMVLSATYRQESTIDVRNPLHARALAVDRDNGLLWHANRRRLEGEALRDAMLAHAGELNLRMFGPSARPMLPAGLGQYAWKPDARPEDRQRRSIYIYARRNMRYPLFDAFDLPDMHNSCSRRPTTTTAPQALVLLNSAPVTQCAKAWALHLAKQHDESPDRLAEIVFASAWGRPASPTEVRLARQFLQRASDRNRDQALTSHDAHLMALAELCHAVLNTNEFAYID